MRYAAQGELVLEVVEPVLVLQNETPTGNQRGLFEVFGKRRNELGHEEWIVIRQAGDELGINREVVYRNRSTSAALGWSTGAAREGRSSWSMTSCRFDRIWGERAMTPR
jgi:hypothetical protein